MHRFDLVLAAQQGDRRSWSTLVAATTPRLRRSVTRYRLQAADVDDVVQMTWLAAWLNLPRLREAAAFDGWLTTIAEREALRVVRRRDREIAVDDMLQDSARSAEPELDEQLSERMQAAALRGAVRRLPQHQRRIVEALLDEPPGGYVEVASSARVPVGSIGPTRARSFARLREDRELCAAVAA